MGKQQMCAGEEGKECEEYNGEWYQGHRHGIGTCAYPNKSVYSGSWANEKWSGEGTLVYSDGRRYEGQWANNRQHGCGNWTSGGGDRKEGQWKMGRPLDDVEWTIWYVNGSTYRGMCKGGRPHGQGTCKYANGDVYTGDWVDGQRSGQGIRVTKEGGEGFPNLLQTVANRICGLTSETIKVLFCSPCCQAKFIMANGPTIS
jgi:hypothetical protein